MSSSSRPRKALAAAFFAITALGAGAYATPSLAAANAGPLVATTPVTNPPATTPATTPDTTPPDSVTPVTTPDSIPTTAAPDNGGDGIDWLPIALVAILGIALISLVVALMSRRKPAAAAAARRTTPVASPQSELLSTAQWVHDQLSLELLAAAPAAALQRWNVERSRVDNVAIRAQQQWTEGHGEMWQRLSQSMSQLGGSLDTSLQLRNQQPPDAQLIQEASNVVTRRRAELQSLLAAMWPAIQR